MTATIDAIELHNLLTGKGAQMVTFTAVTCPKVKGGKKSPFYGVRKRAKVNGVVNWIYANAVNRQRTKENQPLNDNGEVENFVPDPRAWGERVHQTAFVRHVKDGTPKVYIEFKFQRSVQREYFMDGKLIPNEEVEPYLYHNEKEGARQEIENVVILRDYQLSNLEQIQIGGQIYDVKIDKSAEHELFDLLDAA